MHKRIIVITGHYGSGKTNFSLNLALTLAEGGKKITIVDLDVVNPYFRSSDYHEFLSSKGIQMIAPQSAGTTLDVPALSPKIFSVFDSSDDYVIFDAGGDDAGSKVLGRFSEQLCAAGAEMLFVINKFRNQIASPDDALMILREIEYASKMKATGVVNNSHLSALTTDDDVLSSLSYADEICRRSGLPLLYTVLEKQRYDSLKDKTTNPFCADILVNPPWINNNK